MHSQHRCDGEEDEWSDGGDLLARIFSHEIPEFDTLDQGSESDGTCSSEILETERGRLEIAWMEPSEYHELRLRLVDLYCTYRDTTAETSSVM